MYPARIYLTFDLEEFDLPQEYNCSIDLEEQVKLSETGMLNLLPVLEKHGATATIFTTAAFAKKRPVLVKNLAQNYEIASHTYSHSSFEIKDLKRSLIILEQITGQPVHGLRMPRMRQVEPADIINAGYSYDSSINPIHLPGRYNYSRAPVNSFMQNGLLRIPASVSGKLRIPLFWLAFKNLPLPVFKWLASRALKQNGYLNLYFHPWEFVDLSGFNIPFYIKRRSGKALLHRFDQLLDHLKRQGNFDQLKNHRYKKVSL